MPTKVQVVSSNIKSIDWEDNKLLVEYMNGGSYEFYDVPKEKFEEMLQAESKGRYMNANIKGAYRYKKLES